MPPPQAKIASLLRVEEDSSTGAAMCASNLAWARLSSLKMAVDAFSKKHGNGAMIYSSDADGWTRDLGTMRHIFEMLFQELNRVEYFKNVAKEAKSKAEVLKNDRGGAVVKAPPDPPVKQAGEGGEDRGANCTKDRGEARLGKEKGAETLRGQGGSPTGAASSSDEKASRDTMDSIVSEWNKAEDCPAWEAKGVESIDCTDAEPGQQGA